MHHFALMQFWTNVVHILKRKTYAMLFVKINLVHLQKLDETQLSYFGLIGDKIWPILTQSSTTVTFTFGVVKINFWARLCNLQGKDWLYFLELSFPILSSGNSGIKKICCPGVATQGFFLISNKLKLPCNGCWNISDTL